MRDAPHEVRDQVPTHIGLVRALYCLGRVKASYLDAFVSFGFSARLVNLSREILTTVLQSLHPNDLILPETLALSMNGHLGAPYLAAVGVFRYPRKLAAAAPVDASNYPTRCRPGWVALSRSASMEGG